MIHPLLSEPVRGTLAHRPQKRREVSPSLTHIIALQPRQTEQFSSNKKELFDHWCVLSFIHFSCQSWCRPRVLGVKLLMASSRRG